MTIEGSAKSEFGAVSTLRAEHLMKAYAGRQVVKDVSLQVQSGQVVGLLGPNGAGKTTCFYMIVGLVPSDGGIISLDGHSIGHLPIHRRRITLVTTPRISTRSTTIGCIVRFAGSSRMRPSG